MNSFERQQAWDREVATLTQVMVGEVQGARGRGVKRKDKAVQQDARQAALAVLLLGTLPPDAYAIALRHMRHDYERRHPGMTLLPQDLALRKRTLRTREDWTMPPAPREGLVPCAHPVGPHDGWHLYWATPEETNAPVGEWDIPWPFDYSASAKVADFEAIGFLVDL